MCHRSVGLIQNVIEAMGMSTVSLSLKPEITLGVGVPRAAYVRFPLGNPMGEPHDVELQTSVLRDVLEVLEAAEEPNTVFELPYRWRRGRIVDGR
jgi:D-proline reductase (dithiol) PrdB